MTDRIKRNMQPDKPMTLISLRLPDHVIEDLKEVAPSLGFGRYQALIRAYISNGLRKHLAEREAQTGQGLDRRGVQPKAHRPWCARAGHPGSRRRDESRTVKRGYNHGLSSCTSQPLESSVLRVPDRTSVPELLTTAIERRIDSFVRNILSHSHSNEA